MRLDLCVWFVLVRNSNNLCVPLPPPAGTKRVHNNIVYNEYISNREHVHMNATQWETLTDFTKWVGREGEWTMNWKYL